MRKNIIRIIFIAIVILIIKESLTWFYTSYNNKKQVKSYYNNETSFNYKSNMVLSIPKINLNAVVTLANDDFKNLNKSLVYYKNSNYKQKIIIFGHSGMGYATYFNRLNELDYESVVYLYKNKYKITYFVDDIYTIDETNIDVLNNDENEVMLLITCHKKQKNKRLVVKLRVNKVENLKK